MGSCGGNTCSQGGQIYPMSFGKPKVKKSMYKNRVVYTDYKGRYIKTRTINGLTKKYLPKGARTTKGPVKMSPVRKISPVRKSTVRKSTVRKSPVRKSLVKPVKNKRDKKIGHRLSARAIYDKDGYKAVGKKFSILQKDGSYKLKVLKLRVNGSPYFSNTFGSSKHVNIKTNYNWLRGPNYSGMTGLKKSWPDTVLTPTGNRFQAPSYGLLPPAGVSQPLPTSILPRYITSNGIKPHMHFGKMCFGA